VAGLMRKDEEFWKYIEQFDIINLSETWIEKEGELKEQVFRKSAAKTQ